MVAIILVNSINELLHAHVNVNVNFQVPDHVNRFNVYSTNLIVDISSDNVVFIHTVLLLVPLCFS